MSINTTPYLKRAVKLLLYGLPLSLLAVMSTALFIVVKYFFGDFQNDTISLTNYGFGFFVGMASLSFSWAKALEPEVGAKISSKINHVGVDSAFTAVLFLSASFLKYACMKIVFFSKIVFFARTALFVMALAGILALYAIYTFLYVNFMVFLLKFGLTESWLPNRWLRDFPEQK